jgi:L,D-transpeptidase catalytic domain
MRRRLIVTLAAGVLVLPLAAAPAAAELLIQINKSAQRMTVSQDGRFLYEWPVSTGRQGLNTPSGTFKPFRMDIDHYSEQYDNAPMPHSIFFTRTGDAIHGTYEEKWLGNAVSHGCVRLSRQHAAILWGLVKWEKMANTKVVLTGHVPRGAPLVAHNEQQAPMALGTRQAPPLPPPESVTAAVAPRYQRQWNNDGDYYDDGPPPPPPAYVPERRYDRYDDGGDDGPSLPFPFSLFGR